jgi:hypothetical protein
MTDYDIDFVGHLCAAALVSLKMEKPGPFSGTLDDVQARMRGCG